MLPELYLVDASIYIFRAYFSMPAGVRAANGEPVNAVYGYLQFLLDLLARRPAHISFAFDESLTTCFRNAIYPAYKANRELPDENLEFQLAQCQRVTGLLGFHTISLKDYEADDIIGTLLEKFGDGRRAIIVTRDKDLGQLLREDDRLWDFAANEYLGPREIEMKFGVRPDQLPDYLALAGDAVDNIPGAPGIGAKTAAALLARYGNLETLLASDDVAAAPLRGAKKIAQTLQTHRDLLETFQRVTRIDTRVPLELGLEDLVVAPADTLALAAFCDEMAFGPRLRDRISKAFEGRVK
ncbi:MAG: 5'-3' exonuclease H3TH domain-containing protein [Pseudomonadota bacterium]